MLWSIDERRTDGLLALEFPYFEQAEPLVWDEGGTYVETDQVFEKTVTHSWNHGLGEIVTALLDAGMELTMLEEHRSVHWDALPGQMEPAEGDELRLEGSPGAPAAHVHAAGTETLNGPALDLRADHPEVLLELAVDLDQDVLRGQIDLTHPLDAAADAVGDLDEPLRQLADRIADADRPRVDGLDLALRDDRRRPAVRRESDRHGPLGNGVREVVPPVDELVEVQMELAEAWPGDVPVQLLPDERQRDQLDERVLQQSTGLVSRVLAERRQMSRSDRDEVRRLQLPCLHAGQDGERLGALADRDAAGTATTVSWAKVRPPERPIESLRARSR